MLLAVGRVVSPFVACAGQVPRSRQGRWCNRYSNKTQRSIRDAEAMVHTLRRDGYSVIFLVVSQRQTERVRQQTVQAIHTTLTARKASINIDASGRLEA